MTIKTLIEKGGFDERKKRNILSILSNINHLENEITFIIDNSNLTSKFNSEEYRITIPEINAYNSIIHELLHAELIYFYNFPQIKEINVVLKSTKLIRLRKFIFDLTNDIHHFLFYEKHKKLTSSTGNIYLINNQKQLLNPKFEFKYLAEKYIFTNDIFRKIKFFYTALYIPFKYAQLISDNNVNWNAKSLKKVDSDLFKTIDIFFYDIINLDINKLENKKDILKIYSQLFENLNNYIK